MASYRSDEEDVLLPHSPNKITNSPLTHQGSKELRNVCTTPKILVGVLLVILTLLGFSYMDAHRVQSFITWFRAHKQDGAILFIFFASTAIVFLFPSSILSACAGAVYGTAKGCVLMWVANLLGQTVAFMVGRYILRDIVVHYATRKLPYFKAIDSAISRDGWKIILLLRISPVVPYNVLNYALASTGIGIFQFTAASGLGVIPWIVVLVHVGTMARTAVDVASHRDGLQGLDIGVRGWATGLWGVVAVVSIVFVGVYTKRAISHAIGQEGGLESGGEQNKDIEMNRR